MSFIKKIQANKDKMIIKNQLKKSAKHRCPKCHRFSVFTTDARGKIKCIICRKELN